MPEFAKSNSGSGGGARTARIYLQAVPWSPEVVALYVRGELTYDTGAQFEEEIERLVEKGYNTIVLEMHHVTELSNAGGSLLVSHVRAIQDGGGRVTVVQPSDATRATLERLTVLSLLHVVESEDEARDFHRV